MKRFGIRLCSTNSPLQWSPHPWFYCQSEGAPVPVCASSGTMQLPANANTTQVYGEQFPELVKQMCICSSLRKVCRWKITHHLSHSTVKKCLIILLNLSLRSFVFSVWSQTFPFSLLCTVVSKLADTLCMSALLSRWHFEQRKKYQRFNIFLSCIKAPCLN